MSSRPRILAFSGSARADSSNEKLIRHIKSAWTDRLDVEVYPTVADLPLFTPDRDGDQGPELINLLRRQIADADGILICTPEYVFSPPAAIKNLLEWTVSTTVLTGKPTALIVAATGGALTFASLTLILKTLGCHLTPDTSLLISGIRPKISPEGALRDETVTLQIEACMTALAGLVRRS